jgi:transposase
VPVKTDRKAALALAQLHAAGLLQSIWIPEAQGRDRRALVAQRSKMVRFATQARNRLQALLHRERIVPPEGGLFTPERRQCVIDVCAATVLETSCALERHDGCAGC